VVRGEGGEGGGKKDGKMRTGLLRKTKKGITRNSKSIQCKNPKIGMICLTGYEKARQKTKAGKKDKEGDRKKVELLMSRKLWSRQEACFGLGTPGVWSKGEKKSEKVTRIPDQREDIPSQESRS